MGEPQPTPLKVSINSKFQNLDLRSLLLTERCLLPQIVFSPRQPLLNLCLVDEPLWYLNIPALQLVSQFPQFLLIIQKFFNPNVGLFQFL